MAEDLKEKHMKQAADFIRWAEDFREKIYHPDLRDLLEKLIRDFEKNNPGVTVELKDGYGDPTPKAPPVEEPKEDGQ